MNQIEVVVTTIRLESEGVHSFELRALDGSDLPVFTAGAHVEVHMADGLVRSYSLSNAQSERDRYVIAVHFDKAGHGGSRYMHEQIRVGQRLRIGVPRNNFELNEEAEHTILIAGGIGITPLRSMMVRLNELNKPWTLYYCGRDRRAMAFYGEFKAMAHDGASVILHCDSEQGGRFLDIGGIISNAPANSHFYCCGPKPMLAAFEAATEKLPPERVHLEYFVAKEEAAVGGGYVVELARSKRSFEIVPGKTILDTLLDAGINVEFSCMDGICGSCETKVLAGIPDHRDSILSKAEREANTKMLVCCSGSKTAKLVLDL